MNQSNVWLYRFAKATVLAAFTLILIGSLVTTKGAGMAFADWPLSSSSLNPDGWWTNLFQRLEHGHRLFAELTGCLIGILCAWVWGNRWAVPTAFLVSGGLSFFASLAGAPRPWIAHIGLWSSALVFAGMLLAKPQAGRNRLPLTRWLAFAAFCGVIAQAILGGLRVTLESGGDSQTAMVFRVLHGCFAQIEFCLLVTIAVTLSPAFLHRAVHCRGGCASRQGETAGSESTQTLQRQAAGTAASTTASMATFAWVTFAVVFLQLLAGATMRHLGVGLIIPTFPHASPDGSWLPTVHNFFVDLNFIHTRIGALAVGLCGIYLVQLVLRSAGGHQTGLRGPALLLLVLIGAQIGLGITILATHRAVLPTTLHVLNGAAILATTLVLAVKSTLLSPPEEPLLASGSFSPNQPLPGTAS